MTVSGQPRAIHPTFGPKRSVFNNSNSAIGAHLAVMEDSTALDYVKLPTGTGVAIAGITGPEGIPAKSWGSIGNIAGGKYPIVNAGGVTQGNRAGVNTDGKATAIGASAGTNYALLGIIDQTGADGDTVELTFAGPGAVFQA